MLRELHESFENVPGPLQEGIVVKCLDCKHEGEGKLHSVASGMVVCSKCGSVNVEFVEETSSKIQRAKESTDKARAGGTEVNEMHSTVQKLRKAFGMSEFEAHDFAVKLQHHSINPDKLIAAHHGAEAEVKADRDVSRNENAAEDGMKMHPGAVCFKCGKDMTEDEYSSGESKCCHAVVVDEAKTTEAKGGKELHLSSIAEDEGNMILASQEATKFLKNKGYDAYQQSGPVIFVKTTEKALAQEDIDGVKKTLEPHGVSLEDVKEATDVDTASIEKYATNNNLEISFSPGHRAYDRIFYDPIEGLYYDRYTDLFLSEPELTKWGLGAHSPSKESKVKEAYANIVAAGLTDKQDADDMARTKKGVVVPDKDDPKKFSVVVMTDEPVRETDAGK